MSRTVAAYGLAATAILSSCGLWGADPQGGGPPDHAPARAVASADWGAYLGDKHSTQFSALDQVNRSNVHDLEVAWVHRTGGAGANTQIQTNPLVIEGVLYGITPDLDAFAVNAATGEHLWTFTPPKPVPVQGKNRGVVFWRDGNDQRLFYSAGPRLYALNPGTGRPIPSFGRGGHIDLREGLGRDLGGQMVVARTPGVLYGDLLIQGTMVSEARHAAPGHIRAYDVRTGEQRWIFHTIPHPGEYGYETWPPDAWKTAGGANSWAGLALDEERGIVYAPTGAPSIQYYGADIPGANLFSTSLLALDAATGKRIWHFQIVHHDIYDRDLPAPPNLVTVTRGGERVDAVAQVTKTGHVFLFDRETGEPLFEIEERPVPPSRLEGEVAWPTQPIPVKPAPFVRQTLTEEDLTDLSPEARAEALRRFRQLNSAGPFTPPSLEGTLIFPMLNGGAEWGGAAVDPRTGILYVNGNDLPQIMTMQPVEAPGRERPATDGAAVYATYCSGCHAPDRAGMGTGQPDLRDLHERMQPADVLHVLDNPAGFMPSFRHVLSEAQKKAVAAFLLGRESPLTEAREEGAEPAVSPPAGYVIRSNERFVDAEGYPAVKPPWGTLSAIDLNTGETLWRVPLGQYPELTARGIPQTGTENYGGPLVTAGGLVFIAATHDEKFRAFDKDTGEVLWEVKLPFGGYATPATYAIDGKQYIVIAAGGGHNKMLTTPGDAYVAFALPE